MPISIISDMDGILTLSGKFWYEEKGELKVFKKFSDRDSVALQYLQDNKVDLLIISGDKRINEGWCAKKNIPFEYCPPNKSKLTILQRKYPKKLAGKWVYIGDSLVDADCLNAASIAYYPKDVSLFLLSVVNKAAIRVPVDGGYGVLEWVVLDLIKRGLLPDKF